MGFFSEFKEFAFKGNLVDIAVGVVIGAATAKLISSFVDGMVMPVIGNAVSGVDFKNMKYVLAAAIPETKDATGAVIAKAAEEVAVKYGDFITTCLDFTILMMVMFILIKAMNRMKADAPAPPPAGPTKEETLLGEIRDLLAKR